MEKAICVSRDRIRRSHRASCSGVPCRASTEPAMAGETTISSSGQPANASSSITAASSVIPRPPPSNSSGMLTPTNPFSASASHSSVGGRSSATHCWMYERPKPPAIPATDSRIWRSSSVIRKVMAHYRHPEGACRLRTAGRMPAGAYSFEMKAVQMTEFGGPEVLELVDLPTPEPAAGEVLIRVTKSGVNFADTHQRHNQYVAKAELPLVPGSEVAGVREDNGERVIALCGTGGYAEYAVAPADRVWPIPEGVDDDTAVALLLQGLTAWHLHRTAAQRRQGETVVVHSAAGGTGSLTLQLAKPMGAGRTIASASTEEKRAMLEADAVIDSDPEGLGERLLEANDGNEVDVVYDIA